MTMQWFLLHVCIDKTNSSDSFINRNEYHVDNLKLTKARDVTMCVRSVVPGTTDHPRSRLRPREMSGVSSRGRVESRGRHRFWEAPQAFWLVKCALKSSEGFVVKRVCEFISNFLIWSNESCLNVYYILYFNMILKCLSLKALSSVINMCLGAFFKLNICYLL